MPSSPSVRRPRLAGPRAALAALLGLLLALAGIPAAAFAVPVTLYSQTFGSLPGGWSYSGVSNWSVSGGKFTANAGGFSALAALNYSLASYSLSTAGYENVQLRVDYSTTGLAGESLLINHSGSTGGYHTVVNQSANAAEASTGWVSLANADDFAGFVLQISLVGNGVSSPGAVVTIDNLEIRGDEIVVDTVDPTVTLVAPASGAVIPSTPTSYHVTVGDAVTAPEDLDVTYVFTSVADPGSDYTPSYNPDTGGVVNPSLSGTSLAGILGLSAGDQFTWAVEVTDEAGNSIAPVLGTYTYLSSTPVAPQITSGAPGDGVIGVAYSHPITATGTSTVTFAASAGLPPGLDLDASTGVLSGTPTTAGTWTFDVTASNGTAPDDVETYVVTTREAPAITWGGPTDGAVGVAVSQTVTATGTAPLTFSVTAGAVPDGLTLSPGGVLSGTPTTVGTANFSVTASNDTGIDDTESFSMTIDPAPVPPTITSLAPGDGTVGVPYTFTVTATGTPDPLFDPVSGALPDGLTLDPSTGVISGTPTVAGSFTFEIQASNGVGADDFAEYTVVIDPTPIAPTITSTAPADGTVGVTYNHAVLSTGTPTPVVSHSGGSLPPGVSLVGGWLTGTPTTAGSFTFDITAANGTSPDAVETYTIVIDPAPIAPSITGTPAPATVGIAYAFTPTIGGTGPFTVTLTSGALPTGLALNTTTGEITGTAMDTAGDYSIELTVVGAATPDAVLATTIELGAGAVVGLSHVQTGIQTAADGETVDVPVGSSLTFVVYAVDAAGNLIDVTSDVTLASDVPTDVVSGATVSFPHASPHAITVTHTPSLLVLQFVVEVADALSGSGAGAGSSGALAQTGVETGSGAVFALALLALGALTIGARRLGALRSRRG